MAAPDGIVVDVVVCVPVIQFQIIVSPKLMVNVDGVNEKFWTVTMCVVALAGSVQTEMINTAGRMIFLNMVLKWYIKKLFEG